MSNTLIRQFFEPALALITDKTLIDTAFENTQFEPTDGKPWQQVWLMMGTVENPIMTPGFHRETGYLQITLNYPSGKGAKDAEARAGVIIAAFPRGRSFGAAKISLIVSPSPYASPGRADGNRWAIPVKIPFFANVFE